MKTTKKIIDEGTESIVTLVTQDNGLSFVTKTRQPSGKTRYLFEAFAYKEVGPLGSHVPTVISVNENQLTMTAFSGKTIDDQFDLYDDKEIFDHIAKDISFNRKVVFHGYGKPILENGTYGGEHTNWCEFLALTYQKLQASPLLLVEQKQTLLSKWDELLPSVTFDQGTLVHGDFALSAIFVNNKKYEGIIDYGDAFIGDPLMDLAYFRFKEITKDYGSRLYDMLANSYAIHAKITRAYIDKATMFYMIYWAVERVHTSNLDRKIVDKFIDKTQALTHLLNES